MRKLALAIVAMVFGWGSEASAILIDDFSDGTDAGWTHLGNSVVPAGPASWAVVGGRYELSSSGAGSALASAVSATFDSSATDPIFTDGVLSTSVILNTPTTAAAFSIRGRTLTDPAYLLAWNGNGLFLHQYLGIQPCGVLLGHASCVGPELTRATTITPIAGAAYHMQASFVGNALGFSAWASGDAPSAVPQLNFTLDAANSFSDQGGFGFTAYAGTDGAFSASFDDVTFTPIPEPSTALLFGLGLVSMAARRRV